MPRSLDVAAMAPAVGLLVAALVAGCSPRPVAPPAGSAESLIAYLNGVVGADEATRQREVASWLLDDAAWTATVIPSYRPLHADYERAFAAETAALVRRLAQPGELVARRHYAGDPRLTLAQARDRWALPTLYPSLVLDLAGAPIDAVFVPDGEHWRALVGLDAAVRARVAAFDAACAAQLAHAGPTGRCTDVGAAVVTAALRTDRAQLAHVCRLAESLCGKGLP